MATNTDPYSRSYWRFADEFPEIYANDATLALWSRLRDEADKAWPSSAALPYGVKKRALRLLVEAELVIPQPGNRYRIRGLDKERERRAEWGRRSANARWDRMREQEAMDATADDDSIANAMRPHSERSAESMQDKTRQDKTRQEETRRALSARDGLPHITAAVERAAEGITGLTVLQASTKVQTDLDRLVESHGEAHVVTAMQTVADGKRMSWPQVVYGTRNALEPIPGSASGSGPPKQRQARGFLPSDEEVRDAFGRHE